MFETIRRFTLTEDHVKLLRRFYVGWQDCETGAPEIDPKRPYGNSSVAGDIHEILTGESVGMVDSKRDELTDDETERYMALHKETETALQIVLVTGKFLPGTYECDQYRRNWKMILKNSQAKPGGKRKR
jgi:hypothetical protein